jgi:phytoene dehydrogenase-like protein
MATTYDCIIVGAGHNGLICACYLAKAGLRVLVLERRGIVGGAVCTEEIVPGYRFDVGSSAHIMFRGTPIMEELDLAAHGLEYIEMDPWAFYPVPGEAAGISFYRDLEKTCESIARVSPRDADAYRDFIHRFRAVNEGVFETFLKPPTPGGIFGTIFKRNLFDAGSRKAWSSLDTARQLMTSYGRLIEETFESEPMRAALCWLAAQSGPPPEEIATGDLVGWQAMIHKSGAWRAKGGSGALTQALARCLQSMGGEVLTDAPVSRIARSTDGSGARFEVRTARGAFSARSVTAACHVQTTFLELLDPALCPPELKRRVECLRVGNGFGMIVRHAVSGLPHYAGQPVDERGISPCHSSLQLLCPSRGYLHDAYLDYQRGEPPRKPAVLAMTFSALDPTLAPPGKHVLFAWAQYHPYALSNGESWDAIAEREADKIYDVICEYAPNMRGALIDRYIQTPLEIERKLGLLRANVMHLEMSLDQMFFFRPLPELSTYKTPIQGLYLTGASTHPGGGVFGASGRNAAQVVIKDVRRKKV